jgi:phosphoglycolate phosphatase
MSQVNGGSQLVVFDLDGTLIDSRRDLAESANQMLASYGAPPLAEDTVVAMVGEGAKRLVERALEAAGRNPLEPDALSRFLDIYDRQLLIHTRPYPAVVAAVTEVGRLAPVAVLTNKPARPTARLLETFGLSPSVRWTVGGDSGLARKPDPAGLRWLIAQAGARPEMTLLVGDSEVDVETARRAGARVCFARYGFGGLRGPVALAAGDLEVAKPEGLLAAVLGFLSE